LKNSFWQQSQDISQNHLGHGWVLGFSHFIFGFLSRAWARMGRLRVYLTLIGDGRRLRVFPTLIPLGRRRDFPPTSAETVDEKRLLVSGRKEYQGLRQVLQLLLLLTSVSAAFVAWIVGRVLSGFGAGGGGAAV
jgi:hypothetical protein